MTDLQPRAAMKPSSTTLEPNTKLTGTDPGKVKPIAVLRSPASINFIRNRIFYARVALNAKGKVRFGLRHIRTP